MKKIKLYAIRDTKSTAIYMPKKCCLTTIEQAKEYMDKCTVADKSIKICNLSILEIEIDVEEENIEICTTKDIRQKFEEKKEEIIDQEWKEKCKKNK